MDRPPKKHTALAAIHFNELREVCWETSEKEPPCAHKMQKSEEKFDTSGASQNYASAASRCNSTHQALITGEVRHIHGGVLQRIDGARHLGTGRVEEEKNARLGAWKSKDPRS